MCGSSCSGKCGVCKGVGILFGLLFVLGAIAALLGVWNAHMTDAGWVFGSPEGSLSLIALVATGMGVLKASKNCPCRGKGCGAGCGCGDKAGMCPGCGKSPCVCGK